MGYGDSCAAEDELVGAEAFDPYAAESVQAQIHPEYLTIEFFLSVGQKENKEYSQIPEGFV